MARKRSWNTVLSILIVLFVAATIVQMSLVVMLSMKTTAFSSSSAQVSVYVAEVPTPRPPTPPGPPGEEEVPTPPEEEIPPVDPCSDGVLGAGETDVDCGGSCAPCSIAKNCTVNNDCKSQYCRSGTCAEAAIPMTEFPAAIGIPQSVRDLLIAAAIAIAAVGIAAFAGSSVVKAASRALARLRGRRAGRLSRKPRRPIRRRSYRKS